MPTSPSTSRKKKIERSCWLFWTISRTFLRGRTGWHISPASAWLVNQAHDKVLMIYHNIYHSWAWTGGHADGDQDLLHVALKEAREETGITNLKPVSEGIFSLEMLTVDGHVKRGEYVSSHLHANVTYLLEADETDTLHIKPDENSGVRWFALDEALKACSEPWMAEHIYKKLNEKLSLENPDTGRNR